MKWINQSRWKNFLSLLLISTALLFFSLILQPTALANPLIAQSNSNPITQVLRRVQALFSPSSVQGQGAPAGRTKGGAGRGRLCPATQFPVSALVPSLQSDRESLPDRLAQVTAPEIVFGKTVELNPTFWFYIPYEVGESLKTASFMLLDDQEHPVLPEPILIPLANTPGIIEFQLPHSLKLNQLCNWYFSVLCDPFKPSRNAGVRGWVQRIEPDAELITALQRVDLKYQYLAYAEQGIWFDMVTHLAKLYYGNQEDLVYRRDWIGVLDFLGLSELRQVKMKIAVNKLVEAK